MPKIEDGCYGSLKGIALIAKVLAGRCRMHYTRVAAGKGAMPEDLTPKTLTEPPEYVMDAMISSVTNPVDGECQVSVQINSVHVENGFYCTWLILYAEDPDEGEVPFTALCLENEPEWIRPASSIVGKLAHFDIIAAVGDVDNVSATIDPDALVTLESVQQLITEHGRDAETHQDIRQAVKALQDKLGGGVVRAERIELTIPAEGWEPDDETGGVYAGPALIYWCGEWLRLVYHCQHSLWGLARLCREHSGRGNQRECHPAGRCSQPRGNHHPDRWLGGR